MIGDLILWFRKLIKQTFCIHDYYLISKVYLDGHSYYKCEKCERIKK